MFSLYQTIDVLSIGTTYDLVSHGPNRAGRNECYGEHRESDQTSWGPGYQYSCVHSGVIKTSGDLSTVWYNYVLASAGTILDENTTSSSPANNTATATESVCPKGWTLPSTAQIRTIGDSKATYIPDFSPVLGGHYYNGSLYSDTTGRSWGSEAYNGARRYLIYYDDAKLYNSSFYRRGGIYIRCVQKS